MKPTRRNQLLHLANLTIAAPAVIIAFGSSARALDITWENTGDTNFNDGGSWIGGAAPGTADRALFTGAAVSSPALSAPATVQGLSFSTADSSGYTVSGSAITLTSTATGASSAINAANNVVGSTNTISAPIILGGAAATTASFTQANNGTLAISGNISSTNAITGLFLQGNSGEGLVYTLSGNNSYNGTTQTGWVRVNLNSDTALGTGNLVINNNGFFGNTSGSPRTIANNITVSSPMNFNGVGAAGALTFNGAVALNSDLIVRNTGPVTFNGALDASTGNRFILVNDVGGVLTFGGALNIGARRIEKQNAGTWILTQPSTGAGIPVTIGTSAVNNYTVSMRLNGGTVVIPSQAALGAAPDVDFRGTLLVGSVALTGANALTKTLVHAAGSPGFGGSNNIESTGAYILNNGAGNQTLRITNLGTTLLSGSVSMTDHPSAIDNQTLTVNVDTAAGAAEISGVIQNKTAAAFAGSVGKFVKTGGGTLTLSGANTFSGGLDVTGGRLIANNASALGASTHALTVSTAGILQLNGLSFTVGTLAGTAGGTIENGGTSDVTLTTNGASGTFAGALQDGFGGGKLSVVKSGTGTLTLSGFNTHTGDTTVSASNTVELLNTGRLTFVLTSTSGVNSKITGTGTAQFNGTFDIQLPVSAPPTGATWTVVDPALTESYLPSFNVTGWTGSVGSGKWQLGDTNGVYTFNQSTGAVTFAPDLDQDGLEDTWETTYFPNIGFADGDDDNDSDGFTNLEEQAGGSNPTVLASVPGDVDGDTLTDTWEIQNFGNLTAQNASGDPDGDGANNAAEMAAGSSPNDSAWTPTKAKLVHRWNFNGNLNDSVGSSHATIVEVGANNVTQNADSVTLAGGTQATSDYVSLGGNLLGGKTTPVTIELWATPDAVQSWSQIFSFGSSASESLYMTWTRGTNANQSRVQWVDNTGTSTVDDDANPYTLGTKYHIVMTLTPALYTGGAISTGTRVTWYRAPVGTNTPLWSQRGTFDSPNTLATLNDVNTWLGRSAFGDNTASATYDEVRLWDGALTQQERTVAQAAGPNVTDLTTDSEPDGLPDAWETAYFGNTAQGDVDSDGDGVVNSAELADQSNPNNINSLAGDVDADGLADTDFEMAYFADLDENGTGDFDNDFASNELEETGGSIPTNAASWPDTEDAGAGDGLNDGWELFYFGDLDEVATGDPDGDGEDNATEYANVTVPTDPLSRSTLPTLFSFINATTRNGEFELQGPPPGTASGTKRASWDQAGNADVTYWTEWTTQSTAPNDSGVEGGTGVQHAYMQGGNAVYNLTDYVAAEGNTYWFALDKLNGLDVDVYLVYQDADGVIQPITSSLLNSTTQSLNQLKGYQIPAGSPAIGRKIGIGFKSLQSWVALDNVKLGVVASDVDGDTYDDAFEDFAWGDNDGLVEASDRAAGPAGDADGDGLSSLDEINGTLNTAYGNAPTKANDADSDDDGLSDGVEINTEGTNPNVADTDGDGLSDGAEINTYGTDPLALDSDGDSYKDGVEVLYGSDPNDFDSIPDLHELIGLTKRNGSFELLNGVVNGAKANLWDTATAGDVDNWTRWIEQTTGPETDSGTETTGSAFRHGAKHGYIQNGNAVRNMTDYKVKGGDVIRLTYSRTTAGNLTAYLIVDTGAGIVQMPGSATQLTNTTGNGFELVFAVPGGHASIGQPLGIAFKSTGGWEGVDQVVLAIQDRDVDGDGLSDFWEDLHFGDANDDVLTAELDLAKGTAGQALPGVSDPDGDGFDNEAEETAGSNPNDTSSTPNDLDGDGLADTWENDNFGSTTAQNGSGDPDGDGTDNETEFRLGLDPNDGTAGFKVTAVQKSPTSFSLTWPSLTGVTFTVERSTTLAAGSWTTLSASYPGAAGTTTYVDNSLPVGTKAFYKVTLNP